jgi:hypothetical protein
MSRVHAAVATMTSCHDGEGAPQRREMALPLDLRDPRKVVRGLDEALQRLADDPGAATGIVALVGETESALADTGPVELGVSAELFVEALETAARVRARLAGVDAVTRHHQNRVRTAQASRSVQAGRHDRASERSGSGHETRTTRRTGRLLGPGERPASRRCCRRAQWDSQRTDGPFCRVLCSLGDRHGVV